MEGSNHIIAYQIKYGQINYAKEQLLKSITKCTLVGKVRIGSRLGGGAGGAYFTSFPLCCSLLQRNVPNKQLYRWSKMVTRKYSLNSNAVGNCKSNSTNSKLQDFSTTLIPVYGQVLYNTS